MKTIKQIADEIGVSKQAVQKRMAREPLYTSIQPYICTKGKTKYIEVAGENLIKQTFGNQVYSEDIDKTIDMGIDVSIDNNKDYDNLYIVSLQSEIDFLRKEIEKKDKYFSQQLEIKDKQIESLLQLNSNNQQLLLVEKTQYLQPPEEKKKWWKFK